LAHEYDEVLDEAIWAIATRRVPALIAAVKRILPDRAGGE
jgi:uncharacterized protein with HEPN domain